VLLLPVVTLVVLLVVVAALLVRRDLGAGVLATRLGPATAPSWLRSPLGLAWRLQRGALLGWTVGSAVAGLSFGLIAQDMVQFAEQDPETAELLRTLGGGGSIADIVLAAVLTWIGMLAAGGLLAGLAHGLRAGEVGGELARVQGGALVQLPAVWVMAAVGALLFGVLPRLVVGATWAVLAVVLFVTVFGEAPQFDRWLLDLSPFAHLPRLPAAEFTATPATWSAAPDHIDAMSLSTRSSWARKGSLHRTVRWAWSLSLRWTQSTV
jgi:ABC-2 type transport system permease protein